MFQLTRSVTWQALERLRDKTANDRIRDYFTSDPQRFEKMSLRITTSLRGARYSAAPKCFLATLST